MAKRQRDPAREQRWRNRLAAWQTSSLSIRAFCRRHGLPETSFHYWRRELQSRDATASTHRPKFVPVRVLTEIDTVATPPQPVSRHATTVEVRCPSGHVVILPMAAEATVLRHLFAALPHLPGSSREDLPC